MFFKARQCLTIVLVLSLLIPMHVAKSGYAAGRPKIAFQLHERRRQRNLRDG